MRIALLIEHPTWSIELIDRARVRGLDITAIDITEVGADVAELGPFDLWVNRINAMPSLGRSPSVVAAAGHLLLELELRGQRVLNGSQTHRIGGSKAAQAALFRSVGLHAPASVTIAQAGDAPAAAEQVGFPLLTKPNVGGSGAGIVRHDSAAELQAAIDSGQIDLGIDGTGIVQQIIESADGLVHRIEMLGDQLFYGTQQQLLADTFNYCAADGCAIEPGGNSIELFIPPTDLVDATARVMKAADTAVGGVEYIIDAATGRPTFFDFNPYSNFVSGYNDQLGFDPIDRYLDFITTY